MKLRNLFIFSSFHLFVLLLAGCENPSLGVNEGYGNVAIEFAAEASVNAAKTRAMETLPGLTLPAEEDFSLAIAGGKVPIDLVSIADFDPTTIFNAGNYTATALCGDPTAEGFDCPSFEAKTTFRVTHLETTTVDLVARLTNMAVTVDYTSNFENYFADWTATILREGESTDYDPIATIVKDDERPVFMRPEKFYVRVDYEYKPNGATEDNGDPIVRTGSKMYEIDENIGACRWLKVKVDSGNVGGKAITVTFDGLEAEELDTIDVGND